MCVVSALGATLRASGQRFPRAPGVPDALPDRSRAADRSGARTLRFSFGKFVTCANVKTLSAVNVTCFISNQGSLASSDFTMESSVLLFLITVFNAYISRAVWGNAPVDTANSHRVSVPGLDALSSFVSSLSPTSPVCRILYKLVAFVVKFTCVFPDHPSPSLPPHPLHSRSPPYFQNACRTSLLSGPIALHRYCSPSAPPQHRELRADTSLSLVPST